jgi:glutamate 5-kinase
VACLDKTGRKIACGLVNYSAEETVKIAGKNSKDFGDLIGYTGEPELIHRDNMVVYDF